MRRDEFLRKLKRLAKQQGAEFLVDRQRGKGSHWGVAFGDRETVVPDGELAPGTLRAILKQLGIDQSWFR